MRTYLLVCAYLFCNHVFGEWKNGQGLTGANVNCMVSNGNYLYAGTNAGVYISEDNGESWRLSLWQNPSLVIYSLLSVDSIVYAGTVYGVYKTSDAGWNWQYCGLKGRFFNPSPIVMLATNKGVLYASNYDTAFQSSDRGTTWTKYDNSLQYKGISNMFFHDSLSFMFAGAGLYRSANGGSWKLVINMNQLTNISMIGTDFVIASSGGIFVGKNAGTLWFFNSFNLGPGSLHPVTKTYVLDTSILVGTAKGPIISIDKGKTWKFYNSGLKSLKTSCFSHIGTTLFSGDDRGLNRFDKVAESWESINKNVHNQEVYILLVSGDEIYSTTYHGGLFMSKDKGETWVNICIDYTNKEFYGLVKSHDSLFAAVDGVGILLSDDLNYIWGAVGFGLTNKGVRSIHKAGDQLYTHTSTGVYTSSIKNHFLWDNLENGLPANPMRSMSVKDSFLIVGSVTGLYISGNGGSSWSKANDSFGNNTFVYQLMVTDSLVSGYFGNMGLYLSKDWGKTWVKLARGLEYNQITSYTIRGSHPIIGTYSKGIYMCDLDGSNLVDISQGYTKFTVNDFGHYGDYIYAGSTGGFWVRRIGEFITRLPEERTEMSTVLFPNPLGRNMQLSASNKSFNYFMIYNHLGQLVADGKIGAEGEMSLEVSPENGIYIVMLYSSDGRMWTEKLVLE